MESVDELAKEYVISFYNRSLDMFGEAPQSVGWTEKGQLLRYETLLRIADSIEGCRVLDFGCGKGDFYGFLKDRHVSVCYTGLDINRSLIALARGKYPEASFGIFDIERDDLSQMFDYIFLCGVFSLEIQGVDELIALALRRLFAHCRIGLAFNALSAHDPEKDFELHYVSEETISDFALRELSPAVNISRSGIPYDFTMFVYRDRRV